MKFKEEATDIRNLHKQFSAHYRQGETQEAVTIIFQAFEKYCEDPERFIGYPCVRSHDIRPGFRSEQDSLNLAQSFIDGIGLH